MEDSPSLDEFRLLVQEALEEFPSQFRNLLHNLAVVVEDLPSTSDVMAAGVGDPMHLLGLYTGVPFTQWGRGRFPRPPDVIRIYRIPILADLEADEDLKEKVRRVVLHELGHRAGLSEGRLRDLGVY